MGSVGKWLWGMVGYDDDDGWTSGLIGMMKVSRFWLGTERGQWWVWRQKQGRRGGDV